MSQWEASKRPGLPANVMPINDLAEHQEGGDCWCCPDLDDGIWVHHSADQRELFERGERNPS